MVVDLVYFTPIFLYQFQAKRTKWLAVVTIEEAVVQVIDAFVSLDICFYTLLQGLVVIFSIIIYFVVLRIFYSDVFAHFHHFHCVRMSLDAA